MSKNKKKSKEPIDVEEMRLSETMEENHVGFYAIMDYLNDANLTGEISPDVYQKVIAILRGIQDGSISHFCDHCECKVSTGGHYVDGYRAWQHFLLNYEKEKNPNPETN